MHGYIILLENHTALQPLDVFAVFVLGVEVIGMYDLDWVAFLGISIERNQKYKKREDISQNKWFRIFWLCGLCENLSGLSVKKSHAKGAK
jgi:hypothetical protein